MTAIGVHLSVRRMGVTGSSWDERSGVAETIHPASGSKTPGAAVGLAALVATHNPLGLIVSTGMKAYGEVSGSAKIEGRAKQTAKEIADHLKIRFEQEGWIK